MNTCPGCGCLDNAPLCFACTRTFRHKLELAIWLADELQTTVTRQSNTSERHSCGHSSETPLVFDDSASEAALLLHYRLETWAFEIGLPEHTGYTSSVIARFLVEHIIRLTRMTCIAECIEQISRAIQLGMRAIDKPQQRIFYGTCCDIPLYADPDSDIVECRKCRHQQNVETLRHHNRALGRELLITAREAERYIGDINGKHVRANTLTKWVARGKITRTTNGYYRLGDILDRLD